ncbi:MAG: response regulator [Cyanobacteria bacterium P01_A01_bin.45]
MKILVVEDDELVAQILSTVLAYHNYVVEVAVDGEKGWDLVQAFDYDLIILDITLPKLDGISLCRRIRSGGWLIPIMLVTGCNSPHEKAVGLDAGADDYVVKPFEEEEFIARVRALLRRGKINSQPILEWGLLQLDPTSCEVNYGKNNILLTPKEYSLLELFLRNSRRVFSCGMILEHLWSYEDIPSEEAVRTHIKGLRMKLKNAGAPTNFIETVYGIGYRLKSQEEEKRKISKSQSNQGKTFSKITPMKSGKVITTEAIARIWEKYQGRVLEQVNVLLKVSKVLHNQSLSADLRSQAVAEAHTLAGSLGTFGFAEGSKLARQIESFLTTDKLKTDRVINETEIKQFNLWVKALAAEIESSSQTSVMSSDIPQDGYPLLLVVDGNGEISESLTSISSNWKLQIQVANSVVNARQKLYQEHPDVVLIDSNIFIKNNDCLRLLAEFENRKPPVPVIMLTEEGNQSEHWQNTSNSRNTILQKPLSSEKILEAANQVVRKSEDSQAKVLAVDDDPKVLEVLQALLKCWGIKVKTLAEPQKIWETLEETQPDLLILDVEMPGFNGIELCYKIRSHSQWSELPILFLTVHSESEVINQVFSVGADDFVSKPIIGSELVTRIINRLERIKLIRQMTKAQEKQNYSQSKAWQKIFHASGECIKLLSKDGTLLEINPAGLAIMETDETIIGRNIYSIIAPEYRQDFEDLNKSVCQGNQGTLEFEIVTFKGNRRILETHGVPLLEPESNQLIQLAITRDVTARKQVEAEKEKMNLLLETKFKQQQTIAKLGQLALLNQNISTLMDEAIALITQTMNIDFCHILEVLPSGNAMVLQAGIGWHEGLLKQALLSLKGRQANYTLVTKEPVIIEDLRQETRFNSPLLLEEHGIISGVSVPISRVNQVYGVLGIYTQTKRNFNQDDIHFLQAIANIISATIEKQHTEVNLRKAKEELVTKIAESTSELVEINERLQIELGERQQMQSQFAGIVEIATDAIISIDRNQRITLFNKGAEKIFGYHVSEVLGKPLDLLLPKRYLEAHHQYVDDFGNLSNTSRKMGERRQIYGKHKNGSEFPAEASISKLNLGHKRVYTVYLQDISHRRQIERMKDDFVSVVSHELRTPLTSIHGSLGMLAAGLIEASSEDGKRLLKIATDSTERLVKLINNILDIERIESGKITMSKKTCQISDLISQATHIVQPLADKAQVKLEIGNFSLPIQVDCDRIIQTLTNLLSNAIRFSDSGSTVTLTVGEQDSKVLFAVQDTGHGIPKDKLESIFERFKQVDSSDSRNHEGTGLGLAICRSIVELHGGNIWVESKLGVGSTFYVTLPLLEPIPNTMF